MVMTLLRGGGVGFRNIILLYTLINLTAREIIFLNYHLSLRVAPLHQPGIGNLTLSVSPPDKLCRVVSFALLESDPHPLPEWPSKLESQEEQKEGGENHSVRPSLILR